MILITVDLCEIQLDNSKRPTMDDRIKAPDN